jgi:hypothetical protein
MENQYQSGFSGMCRQGPNFPGRVDQAQRIHRAADDAWFAMLTMVDPLRLIRPTTANENFR